MPWKEVSAMSLKKEFVFLATNGGACNFSHLCSRFGISRKTGYKWIKRFLDCGEHGLIDQSRRPVNSPCKTSPEMEQAVLMVRKRHPVCGEGARSSVVWRIWATQLFPLPAPSLPS